jgi:hypothetical protein
MLPFNPGKNGNCLLSVTVVYCGRFIGCYLTEGLVWFSVLSKLGLTKNKTQGELDG